MAFKQQRLLQLDVLRCASIIGVILIHIIGSSFHFWNEGSTVWTVLISIDQLLRFSVPLFVFISGYTLYSKYAQDFKYREFYWRRVVRVIPWYLVWSLIIYIYINFTVIPGFVNYPTWKLILLGKVDYHLYFVSMIFQLYLVFPVLLWLYKKFRASFVISVFIFEAILYLIFSLDGQKTIHLPWRFYEQQQYLFFGTWVFYFVLGFVLSEKRISSSKKFVFPFITLAILAYSVYNSLHLISQTADTNVATRSTRIPLLLYSTSFIISALVYSDLLVKMKKVILRILLYFAKISFLVYLIHALMIRILGNFILPNSVLNLIIFTALVFSLSIFLAQLSLSAASKIPFQKLKSIL
ncbi:MAG: acyltransferase [Candidatus Curtissbacteria bacterium]|nr:acyltransferase [Candidatus Curtissbacteria bacterium]